MTIYNVLTVDDFNEGTFRSIAYATGTPEKILQTYEPQKFYELGLEPITVVNLGESSIKEVRTEDTRSEDLPMQTIGYATGPDDAIRKHFRGTYSLEIKLLNIKQLR